MTSSPIPSVSQKDIGSLITAGFRKDDPSPVVLLGDVATGLTLIQAAAFDVAHAGDRPFALLPRDSVESDGLAIMSVNVSDLAQAIQSMRVPHAAGGPFQIQQTQSLIANLRALGSAERSVLAIQLTGQDTAQEMSLALSALLEPHGAVGVDLTQTAVFWCGPTAQSLPSAYRNTCQVFELVDPELTPRRTGP